MDKPHLRYQFYLPGNAYLEYLKMLLIEYDFPSSSDLRIKLLYLTFHYKLQLLILTHVV